MSVLKLVSSYLININCNERTLKIAANCNFMRMVEMTPKVFMYFHRTMTHQAK